MATLGNVLLRLRDPFLGLQNAAEHASESLVVTDVTLPQAFRLPLRLGSKVGSAVFYRPEARTTEPKVTWWRLTAHAVQAMIAVLGFEDSTTTRHTQIFQGRKRTLFTVVGRRTHGAPGAVS